MAPGIDDNEVLEAANQHDALRVTADKDFGEPVFRLGRLSKGAVSDHRSVRHGRVAGQRSTLLCPIGRSRTRMRVGSMTTMAPLIRNRSSAAS